MSLTVRNYTLHHFLLYVLTPLKTGTGFGKGEINRAIQKNAYGIPIIYSTSIKGALAVKEGKNEEKIECINDLYVKVKGINNFTTSDAFLLTVPTYDKEYGIVHVTSKFLLKKFYEFHNAPKGLNEIEEPITDIEKNRLIFKNNIIDVETHKEGLVKEIKTTLNISSSEHILIMPDEKFINIINSIIIKQPRIRIEENETRLWYEEMLPSRSKLHFYIYAAQDISCLDGKILQIGGRESTGGGFAKVIKI